MLCGILLVDTVELKAEFFGQVLRTGDLDDGRLAIRPVMAGDDCVLFYFGFEERSDAGDNSDTHFDRGKASLLDKLCLVVY